MDTNPIQIQQNGYLAFLIFIYRTSLDCSDKSLEDNQHKKRNYSNKVTSRKHTRTHRICDTRTAKLS